MPPYLRSVCFITFIPRQIWFWISTKSCDSVRPLNFGKKIQLDAKFSCICYVWGIHHSFKLMHLCGLLHFYFKRKSTYTQSCPEPGTGQSRKWWNLFFFFSTKFPRKKKWWHLILPLFLKTNPFLSWLSVTMTALAKKYLD